jgi:hypothetical protein
MSDFKLYIPMNSDCAVGIDDDDNLIVIHRRTKAHVIVGKATTHRIRQMQDSLDLLYTVAAEREKAA